MAPSLAGLFQIAYVTPDLTRATAALGERFGLLDWTSIPVGTLALHAPTGATVAMKVLVAWSDTFQIELIQPEADGLDIYRDGLPRDGGPMRFHHLGIAVAGNLAEWQMTRDALATERIAMEGAHGPIRFVYVDERATLGHYLEYVWVDPDHARTRPEWRGLTLIGAKPAA